MHPAYYEIKMYRLLATWTNTVHWYITIGDILRRRGVQNTRILEYSYPKLDSSAFRKIGENGLKKLYMHVKLCVAEYACVWFFKDRIFGNFFTKWRLFPC